jgi:transient-receptor-potential-like protein
MADKKKDPGGVGYQIEAPSPMPDKQLCDVDLNLTLPKPLTLEEKKYLLAVERGDMANVRRFVKIE